MEADRFDNLTRAIATDAVSRRTTLKVVALGGFASLFGGFTAAAEAGNKKCKKCRKRLRRCRKRIKRKGPCHQKNWCTDRTQTCGPSGGFGKCLVRESGGNVCAEILFQVQDCAQCAEPNCSNCICVLAAGGGDRCNNGANGFDFICAREVASAPAP
jgi:hypothetical protein